MAELDQNTGTLRAVQGPFYWSTWLSKCDKMEKPRELSCWSENNFVFTSGIIFHTWNSKHLQTDIIISVLQVEKNRNGERLSIDWLHCPASGSRKAPLRSMQAGGWTCRYLPLILGHLPVCFYCPLLSSFITVFFPTKCKESKGGIYILLLFIDKPLPSWTSIWHLFDY